MRRITYLVVFTATFCGSAMAQTLPTGRTTVIPNELRNLVDGKSITTDKIELSVDSRFAKIKSILIKNSNSFSIKDVIIICEFYGGSGTIIDSKRITIYEKVGPKAEIRAKGITVGFIHEQAKKYSCSALGASMS